MSKGTDDKGMSDIEREYDEETKGKELPGEKKLDPFAERFYELSSRTFKTETELDDVVNRILNDVERDYFFEGLLKKTKKGGKLLLERGMETFKGSSAFQAASGITQLARGNLKGTLGTLAKAGLKGGQAGAPLSALETLGFEAGKEGTKQNREAWQNFAEVCKKSFDYLAENLSENADDPLEASKLAAEAFSTALEKVKSERQRAYTQEMRKTGEMAAGSKRFVSKAAILALGVICIVLAAGLVGAISIYTSTINNLQSQITEKDNTISSLNSTISSLNRTNQVLQNAVDQYRLNQTSVSDLQNYIGNLTSYFNNFTAMKLYDYLVYSQTLNQAAGANTTIFADSLIYAGYVAVGVQSSSNTTYVGVFYSSFGVYYDNNVTVGLSGTAAFPILPGPVQIIVGNTEAVDSVNATVTATYHY